ncbi:MAG: hypothetical protein PHI85_06735 [Victivallaceae bacterium]|nr:hypothetical protein [Victivallaceae bacterium]
MQYSHSNDPRVEQAIDAALNGISGAIAATPLRSRISAAVLCGGYGRGEGGATPDGRPYNDLDFFIVTGREDDRELADFLRKLSTTWSAKLAIDVDFTVTSPRRLKRNERTLMIQEMLAGHRLIYGDGAVIDRLERRPWNELPLSEGARLLLNRGTGLLLARRQLLAETTDCDFVRRNLHKSALGCGDALLIAAGTYRQTGDRRLQEVEKIGDSSLSAAYRAALNYKYSPEPPHEEDLPAELETAIELWRQTRMRFPANFPVEHSWRNVLLNLRYATRLPQLSPLSGHPRWKLIRRLAELLTAPPHRAEEAAYLELWTRFN